MASNGIATAAAAASSSSCSPSSLLLNEAEYALVTAAFNSFDVNPSTACIALTDVLDRFNVVEHPRVKDGTMAPSAARDTLRYQFGRCAAEHDGGGVTLDEFLLYHDKLVDEAYGEQGIVDVDAFIKRTIMGLWRLGGDLLLPTGVRPCFPITEAPRGLHGSTLMTLVWSERVAGDAQRGTGVRYALKGVKDVVRPTFKRGDLPEDLQGFFAYPQELAGMDVTFVPPQISIQRWLDFVWEYDEQRYCGVPGIISTKVDLDALPAPLRALISESSRTTGELHAQLVPTSLSTNPTYKRSSDSYGYGVREECKRLHAWKVRSLAGRQYGLQYAGLQGKYFSKMAGSAQSSAATGMNL